MNKKSSSAVKNRIKLTLAEKKTLAAELQKETNKNQRFLADKYSISVGLVNKLINLDTECLNIGDNDHKIRNVKLRKTGNIDPILYRWFQESRSRNMTISSDLMINKALKIDNKLGVSDFKASTGWLSSFIKRQNITS